MAQYFNVTDLTSDDHIFETIKYVGKDCKSSICYCAISQSASAFISTIVEDLSPVGYFVLKLNDVLNPVDYANGNEPNMIFIRSVKNEVYKNGELTFVKFVEDNILDQRQVAKLLFDTITPKTLYILDSKKKKSFPYNALENTVYTLSNIETSTHAHRMQYPNQICGLSASFLVESILHHNVTESIILYLCEPDEMTSLSFAEWARLILDKIDHERVSNLANWQQFNFDDVLNHSLHNLIILQGGILAMSK